MYLWLKVAHLFFVISWVAGLLYLPRLYVYHALHLKNKEITDVLVIMERRLLRMIMTPAMILAFLTGSGLAMIPGIIGGGWWFYLKLIFVLLLAAYHGTLAKWRRAFEKGTIKKSDKFFRLVNEIPAVILLIVLILVVVKPI